MTDDAAGVVCSQLGLGGSGSTIKHAPFGEGNGTIWLSRVRCSGDEYRLEDCPNAGWGAATGCSHAEDVGVSCLGSVGAADVAPGVGERALRPCAWQVWRRVASGPADVGAEWSHRKVRCRPCQGYGVRGLPIHARLLPALPQ